MTTFKTSFKTLCLSPNTEPLFYQTDKDPFGCDPFAILHAPTRDGSTPARPTSPSPALPPKKKQPPPRPAPPRPTQPPSFKKSPQSDPFSSDPFANSGQFADFSDFDAKVRPTMISSFFCMVVLIEILDRV